MTQQEVLTKAIKLAIANGLSIPSEKFHFEGNAIIYEGGTTTLRESVRSFIYDHDFARALWGDTWPSGEFDDDPTLPVLLRWQYYLQQMVISENPIKYLGEHI